MIRLANAALLALGIAASCALAQTAPKIFVASTGNDSNDGSRASPKRSFQAAHDAVPPDGEIVASDTAGYDPVKITKKVSIVVPPGVSGFVTTTTSDNAITIRAGSTGVVTLRGLIIEGAGSSFYGSGNSPVTVGTLIVEASTIRNLSYGIDFLPANTA